MDKIIVFFVFIYTFLFRKLKFSWVKFFLTTIALLGLTFYYINCQKIYTNSNVISVQRLLGTDSIVNMNIHLFVNSSLFNSSFHESNSQKFGNSSSIIEIKAVADSTANIFSCENLKILPDSLKKFYISEKQIIEEKFGRKNISTLLDKIDVLYHFTITTTKPPSTGNIFRDMAFFNDNYLFFCDYAYEDEKVLEYSVYLGYDREINITGNNYDFIKGLLIINYNLFSFLSPIDISKIYYDINLIDLSDTKVSNISTLNIDFGSHTEFSEMYPEPNYKDVSSIKFNDKETLHQLFKGLRFHAKITDNEVVQTTKMFIITTLLSALFAYWIALFYNLISSIIKELRTR